MAVLGDTMKKLNYPFSPEAVRELKVGDMVLITGKLFTGRDAVHKYLHDGNNIHKMLL